MRQAARLVAPLAGLAVLLLVIGPSSHPWASDLPPSRPAQQAQHPPATQLEPAATVDAQSPPPPDSKITTQTAPLPPGNPSSPPAVTLDNREAAGILGKEVRSTANENMGRIIDVIVERNGTVRAAIIDFGGFLGVGSRKIAVDWNALHFAQGENRDRITLQLTRDQVKAAPEYQEGKPIIVLGALTGADKPRVTSATPER